MDKVLSKPADKVYFHDVMPLFRQVTEESSIGKSPELQEFMDNFGVELTMKIDGETGWDIFCLDYKFDKLLQPVMDKQTSLMLKRLSTFFLKLRRIYYKMNEIWIKMKKILKSDKMKKSTYNLILRCNYMRT